MTAPNLAPGDPWWGQDLHPEHPIVLPPEGPPPDLPPNPPADPTAKWVYTDKGWYFTVGPLDKPKPQ